MSQTTAPLLLDLTHTSHTRARTGIQRMAQALLREMGTQAQPICFDRFLGGWRPLKKWELANLAADSGAGHRGARWPIHARLRGTLERWLASRNGRSTAEAKLFSEHSKSGFFCPEIFSSAVAAALPRLLASVGGPRAAAFHDAIALQYPEFTPRATVARTPAYLQELLLFDGVVANSENSRSVLLDYWRWLGIREIPPVAAIPLAVDLPPQVSSSNSDSGDNSRSGPIVLSVGTIEGRKNHLALLEACDKLWGLGRRFELRLIGLARPETAQAALGKIEQLKKAGQPLRYDGVAPEAALEAAYLSASFTVYPSLIEGFGLPVAESLVRGKPCVCSGRGALGEIAKGGGCLVLDGVSAAHLEVAIDRLLSDPAERRALASAAAARRFRNWADYTAEVAAWLKTLPRRNLHS